MKILGFDIGITSIGWAYVEGEELKDCGVRIFTKAENPKTGESLALPRREARSTRRRLARRKTRLNAIKRLLCKEFGLNLSDYVSSDGDLPKAYQTSKDTKSPYELRTLALEQKLESKDFARVILHIAKHRGYGNKHAKRDLEAEEKIKEKIKKEEQENTLKAAQEKESTTTGDSKKEEERVLKVLYRNEILFKSYQTVGEYFYKEFEKNKQRIRNTTNFYHHTMRQEWLKAELELIFKKQREFGAKFSEEFENKIIEIAFFQRDLKSFEDKVGKCTFYENEPRAPKDAPSAVEFIALGQIINTLKNLEEQSLKKGYGEKYNKEKAQEILNIILSSGKITYKKMREILALPKNIHFPKGKNLDYTKGNISTQIRSLLFKISKKVKPKEKMCIYSKEQEIQVYDIVQEKGKISYAKLREILRLEVSIKFDDTLLGKNKGLDYTKENIEEATFAEIKEKNPESSIFISFENLVKFKEVFEPKESKKKSAKIDESSEDFEESDEVESSSGVFTNLLQNHRNELDSIAQDIANEKSKDNLRQKLEKYEILKDKDEWLNALSNLSFSHHINLSFKALGEILPLMREGMRYDEAVKQVGLQEHKKHQQKGNFLSPLKEYEPYLANPVVARALSEYRKVLNALLRKYGKVHKIHIEFTREAKLSPKERQRYEKEQKEHFNVNEMARKECENLGLESNGKNILKMKLWKEQGEYCAYSGEKITITHLKDSTMLEIDHIYPRSRSFDDSYMNKVLVFTKENQNKIDKTPYEAFSGDKEKWENIVSFAQKLPYKKRKRILNTHFDQTGFITRNLNDTGYIARLASQWTKDCLEFLPLRENEVTIAGEKGSKVHVEVMNGSLTAMLRHYWGLGNKNRDNHLHHAVDAVIIGFTNAGVIKAFSDFRKLQEQNKAKFYAKQIAESEYKDKRAFFEPCKNFRQMVLDKVDSVFVSKPPRKRARGALHEETFYSFDDKKLRKEYGGQKGIERALELGKIRQIGTKIVSNGAMVRVDIFKHKQNGKFYGVPIYTMDFALGILPNKAVVGGKDKEGVIKDWKEMNPDDFCFSLFKDDLILVQKKDMEKPELCYFKRFKTSGVSIEVLKHDNRADNITENQEKLFKLKLNDGKQVLDESLIAIQNLKIFEKYQVSPLGEYQKAEFQPRKNISLKTTKKKNGV